MPDERKQTWNKSINNKIPSSKRVKNELLFFPREVVETILRLMSLQMDKNGTQKNPRTIKCFSRKRYRCFSNKRPKE